MLAAIVLVGCSSMSEVMPGADGTFSVSTTGRSTQTPFEVLTDLYKVAEKFCGERGMAVEVIKKDIKAGRAGSDPDVRIGVGGGSGKFSSGFGGGIGFSIPVFDGEAPQADMVFRCIDVNKQ